MTKNKNKKTTNTPGNNEVFQNVIPNTIRKAPISDFTKNIYSPYGLIIDFISTTLADNLYDFAEW